MRCRDVQKNVASKMADTWALVTTTNADAHQVDLFLSHHLLLGACRIDLYLDDPLGTEYPALARHPDVRVIRCDETYWSKARGGRPDGHVQRQIYNATQSYRDCKSDWIGHIDIDEFILTSRSIAEALAGYRADVGSVRLEPVEKLADHPATRGHGKMFFKRAVPWGERTVERLTDLFPEFGTRLKSGLVSHVQGKIFARTGIHDAKLGIHRFKPNSIEIKNRNIHCGYLGHFHCATDEEFLKKMKFRLSKGSYRPTKTPEPTSLHDLFSELAVAEGEQGLLRFYDEVCKATPRLVNILSENGLLIEIDLDLEDTLRRFQTFDPPD